jgi:hypothetical protein
MSSGAQERIQNKQRKVRDKDRKITERKGTRIPDRTMDKERTVTGTMTK